MAEEPREKWLNWLALTTLIFSAAATLASFKGGGYSGTAMMEQNMASDKWAYYQAKSIKLTAYELQREALSLQALQASEAVQAKYRESLDRYSKESERYKAEKTEIESEARAHEKTKEESQRLAGLFGLAVLFLQVGIILSALAALLKKPILWYGSFIPGLIGLTYFVNGFWLIYGKH